MRVRSFRAKVWVYPGMAAWRFISFPKKLSANVQKTFGGSARGWGSLPIAATVGKTTWRTSIFPDKKSGTYLLPLKAEVRKREQITDGSTIAVGIEIQA